MWFSLQCLSIQLWKPIDRYSSFIQFCIGLHLNQMHCHDNICTQMLNALASGPIFMYLICIRISESKRINFTSLFDHYICHILTYIYTLYICICIYYVHQSIDQIQLLNLWQAKLSCTNVQMSALCMGIQFSRKCGEKFAIYFELFQSMNNEHNSNTVYFLWKDHFGCRLIGFTNEEWRPFRESLFYRDFTVIKGKEWKLRLGLSSVRTLIYTMNKHYEHYTYGAIYFELLQVNNSRLR